MAAVGRFCGTGLRRFPQFSAYNICDTASNRVPRHRLSKDMNDQLRGDENFVIDSVARSFSGTWRSGENPPDAYLSVNNREVAVEISTLMESRNDGRGGTVSVASDYTPPGQLANELQEELQAEIPFGRGVILDLKWPFLNKRALRGEIRQLLLSAQTERKLKIEGNEIAIKISSDSGCPGRVDAVISSSALPRYDIPTTAWCILQERVAAKAEKCRSLKFKGPVWLALRNRYLPADAETYRRAMKMFAIDHPFEKILLVSRDGSVDELSE
jgi:hypothetical protein